MSAAEQLSEAPARRRRRGSPRVERLHLSVAPRTVATFAFAALVLGAGLLAVGYQLGLRAAAPAGPEARPMAALQKRSPAPASSASVARPATASNKPAAPVQKAAAAAPSVSVAATEVATPDPSAPKSASAVPAAALPAPKVPSPTPAPAVAPPVLPEILSTAPTRGYGVQIGAYEDAQEARAFIASVADGLGSAPVHLIAAEVADGRVWHRIRVGHYRSRRKAAAAQAKLPTELAKASMVVRYR